MTKTTAHLPWFKFFGNDFLGRIVGLTNEEVGMYIKLMAYSWSNPLPNKPAVVASVVGGDASVVIQRFFEEDESGMLFDTRLRELKDEAIEKGESASERGKRGGQARARKAQRDDSGKYITAPNADARDAQRSPASATLLDQQGQTNTESETESHSDANTNANIEPLALARRSAPSFANATDGAPVIQLPTGNRQPSNWTVRPPFGAAPPNQRGAGVQSVTPKIKVGDGSNVTITEKSLTEWQGQYPKADIARIVTSLASSSVSAPFADADAIRAEIIYRAQRACKLAS